MPTYYDDVGDGWGLVPGFEDRGRWSWLAPNAWTLILGPRRRHTHETVICRITNCDYDGSSSDDLEPLTRALERGRQPCHFIASLLCNMASR
ncbi:hypothetical protein IQ07DRAFT_127631 [Pyrenochaeta sp. DS3sAY3a]|nr:hypothetical protein IQ07DRAFT_127631 [Pyrenochaeta sp. DS3sAY3a]